MQQLDIFEDGAERMRLNDLASALERDDMPAARLAAAALSAEFPDNPQLNTATLLISSLTRAAEAQALPDLDAAARARDFIERDLAPAATALLGAAEAGPWLARRWRELALRAAALPFQRDQADSHAAALWLRAGAWAEAMAAVQRIESWRRVPQALAWMLHARCQADGIDACWPWLAELCWLAPTRAPAVLASLPDHRLHKALRRFEGEFDLETERIAWLPAWLAIDQPLLATTLAQAQAVGNGEPERAFRLVVGLIALEGQGRHHDIVARRKQLRDLQPDLLALYMRSR